MLCPLIRKIRTYDCFLCFLLRRKRVQSRNGTIRSITFFTARMIFSVQELDFFFVAQGFGLDVKGGKKKKKEKQILRIVFCPDCEFG